MRRRERDAIDIPGDYQTEASSSGYAAQRFWHAARWRVLEKIAPPRSGAMIADVGCGSGLISARLAAAGSSVFGFDANPAAIAFASRMYGSPRLHFVGGSFERMLEFAPFDQIYCLEVLEHLYEEQAVETLRLFSRAAHASTELFVTTPNRHSAWPLIEWSLDTLRLVPQLQEAQHLTLFTRKTLHRAFSASGWHVNEIGSFNGIAPFVATVSETLARRIEEAEFASRETLPLNLLYCRASSIAPAPTGAASPF